MTWQEIKDSIIQDLDSRGLKNSSIRKNALNKIEEIFKLHFPYLIQNPKEGFGKIEKNEFKARIAKYKPNGRLNSAESSIINEIYYRI